MRVDALNTFSPYFVRSLPYFCVGHCHIEAVCKWQQLKHVSFGDTLAVSLKLLFEASLAVEEICTHTLKIFECLHPLFLAYFELLAELLLLVLRCGLHGVGAAVGEDDALAALGPAEGGEFPAGVFDDLCGGACEGVPASATAARGRR